MKVRWLGNSALEIFGDNHILVDPHYFVEPEKEADIVLLTHEHDDHFKKEHYEKYGKNADLYTTETALEKFDLEGKVVEPGDESEGIKVYDNDCWGTDDSIAFYYKGVITTGDSPVFPEVDDAKLIFTACFPDYYDDYIEAFKRLEPRLVVPFHYDPSKGTDDAEGLIERMDEEGINNKFMEPGESIEI
ncbi:MAG: MBL fold metallo-hydrolase [Thermoplasmata archaeon]